MFYLIYDTFSASFNLKLFYESYLIYFAHTFIKNQTYVAEIRQRGTTQISNKRQ
jgi:hypothetical protein